MAERKEKNGNEMSKILEIERKVKWKLTSLFTHVMNRILISQPIRSFNGIVRMPPPIVFRHVSQRRIDSSLSRDRVRSCREQFRDTRSLESSFGESECRSKSSSSSSAVSTRTYQSSRSLDRMKTERIEYSHNDSIIL